MKNTPKEWSLIQNIHYRVHRQNQHTIVPMGDDAYVFKNYPGYSVICQDMLVEDIHFKTDYFSAYDLGYKSLAVNFSDVAAMAARPHLVQVSLALPKDISNSWIDDFYLGMTQLADQFNCEIVGGDLCGSTEKIVIDVSVHGSTDSPISRKGAVPGDFILGSGNLGLSQTGMLALQKRKAHFEEASLKHLRPHPRLDLVPELLTKKNMIKALMDCSDGLINDVLQLSPAQCGFHIFADSLPIHPETGRMAIEMGLPVEDFALWGGEDFELLIAVEPKNLEHFKTWNLVGQFTQEPQAILSYSDHKKEITEFKGWQHFT
jgi:thiamine-monophosphate kinase